MFWGGALRKRIVATGASGAGGGVWFASPWIVGFLLLYMGPMCLSMVLSLVKWDGLSWSSVEWVGLDHFQRVFGGDRYFLKALGNSIAYTAMNVPLQIVVGLGIALLVRQSRKWRGVWTVVYYSPHILGGVATILIWWWLFNPQVGPINGAIRDVYLWIEIPLSLLGVTGVREWSVPAWLFSPFWAKPSLVLMNLWQTGGVMLIFLAALLRGDATLYEVAELDGAGRFRRFVHVTLPMVSPAILFSAVTGIIFSMQAFNQAFLLRNYQQQDSLLFYVLHMYQVAFEHHQFGYAAALAWVLLGLLLVFTLAAVWMSRRWVHYDMDTEGLR